MYMTLVCNVAVAPISLRLIGRSTHNAGRLEVFYGGVWGTVCGDLFSNISASVACKQLGYTGGTYKRNTESDFEAGTGLVWMNNVQCKGTESTLTSCRYLGWGVIACHNKDVELVCTGAGDLKTRASFSRTTEV